MTRRCSRCRATKPVEQFAPRRLRGGHDCYCKPCRREYAKKWYDHDRAYEKRLKYDFGLTMADYTRMLAEQHNACAICHRTTVYIRNGKPVRMHVDHDHKTGRIRGLLCVKCNSLLGYVDDDAEMLRRAISYLEPK